MMGKPVLVVAAEAHAGELLVRAVRDLRRLAFAIDSPLTAVEMMQAIDFGLVIIDVATADDRRESERLASVMPCPVAVVTAFLARDRRYRTQAFRSGVSAYVCKPWTRTRLQALLDRLASGERDIEILGSAPFSD